MGPAERNRKSKEDEEVEVSPVDWGASDYRQGGVARFRCPLALKRREPWGQGADIKGKAEKTTTKWNKNNNLGLLCAWEGR